MRATCTYVLTEDAQRAQMAATGQPVARSQSMEIEVTAEDLALCFVSPEGLASIYVERHVPALVASGGWQQLGSGAPVQSKTPTPDVLADIRRGIGALKGAYQAACEVASQYVLDTPELMSDKPENSYYVRVPHTVIPKLEVLDIHPKIEHNWDNYGICSSDLSQETQGAMRSRWEAKKAERIASESAAIDAWLADPNARCLERTREATIPGATIQGSHPRWKELYSEIQRRNAADADAKEDAEREAGKAKIAYISAWIAEHGDALIRQQYGDGLLSRTDATAMIAAQALDACLPLAAQDNPTCGDYECPCGSKGMGTLPREVYPAWLKIQGELPEGYAVSFERRRDCRKKEEYGWEESAGPEYWVAVVTIPCGPFKFKRTVRL